MSNPASASKVSVTRAEIQQGQLEALLLGAGASSLLIASFYGLWQLYSYYAPRSQHYKLIYFNGRGLMETSRLLFAIAKVPYEDYRYQTEGSFTGANSVPEFVATRETLPFTRVPVLEHKGLVLAQSRAIERYLAKQFGLFGTSALESQLIDAVGEEIRDIFQLYRDAKSASNAEAEKKKFFTEVLPLRLRYLNRYAVAHSSSSTYSTFVGSSLTLADVQLYQFASSFDDQESVAKAFSPYPNLVAIRAAVANNAGVKKWVAERPQTAF